MKWYHTIFKVISVSIFLMIVHAAAGATLKGVNIGADPQPPFGEDNLRQAVVSASTFGANLVRWQLRWDGTLEDRGVEISRLQSMLPVFRSLQVKVLVDLHFYPNDILTHRDAVTRQDIVANPTTQNAFVEFWEGMAFIFAGDDGIYGFDLLNEPPAHNDEWRPLAARALRAIRAYDPNRRVIVEPSYGRVDRLQNFTPFKHSLDPVIYSVHMYEPVEFTAQRIQPMSDRYDPSGNTLQYPGPIAGRTWNKAELKRFLKPVRDYQVQYSVPIFVGEFSAARWAPGAATYLTDLIALFDEAGWPWAYHAWRESHIWDVEKTADPANNDQSLVVTDRGAALRNGLLSRP